jgi:hypothetical protein
VDLSASVLHAALTAAGEKLVIGIGVASSDELVFLGMLVGGVEVLRFPFTRRTPIRHDNPRQSATTRRASPGHTTTTIHARPSRHTSPSHPGTTSLVLPSRSPTTIQSGPCHATTTVHPVPVRHDLPGPT